MATFKEAPEGASTAQQASVWLENRFPTAFEAYRVHLSEYYAPKNFNFWYFFGSLALLVLVIQIVTGIFLVMHTGHAGAQEHTDLTDEPHNHPNESIQTLQIVPVTVCVPAPRLPPVTYRYSTGIPATPRSVRLCACCSLDWAACPCTHSFITPCSCTC
jgi:hypothetical protein